MLDCTTASLESIHGLASADVIHEIFVGSGGPATFAAKAAGKRVVRQWIGSDVLQFKRRLGVQPGLQMRALERDYARWTTATISVWHNIRDEIQPIPSTVLPLVSEDYSRVKPAGSPAHRVLCYSAPGMQQVYGLDRVLRTAELCPTLEFRVVGADSKSAASGLQVRVPKNVTFLGRVPQERVAEELDVALAYYRPSRHDGLPCLVLESLARRVPVMYSQELPGCERFSSEQSAADFFNELANHPRRLPQSAASRVTREFNYHRVAKAYAAFYEALE